MSCYYCTDYDLEEGKCGLYDDPVDNCDSFEFDTGIDDESIENGDLGSSKSDTKRTCDESCEHCDPFNEICTKHEMGISPYEECLDYSIDKHRKRS